MRRAVVFLAAVFALGGLAQGQDAESVILTYQRNFARSSLATKLELLKEAGKTGQVGQGDMGPLYDTALVFVLDNVGLLGDDAQLRDLCLLAIKKAGESALPRASEHLWSLFQVYSGDSELRAAAVQAYALTGAKDDKTSKDLASFVASQNSLFRSGVQPEYPSYSAAVEALGSLGDPTASPVLFATYTIAPNSELKALAAASLSRLKGDLRGFLEGVISSNSVLEKISALDLAQTSSSLSPEDQGRLAETALSAALDWKGDSPVELSAARRLRIGAARVIGELRWQRAAPLVIRHFRSLLADYNDGKGAESELLEAVATLGQMGSTDAAQALALYLQLFNAQTEQGKPYDQALLLGVIEALGSLGDKIAFDYLLYVGYLQYPETIKTAARTALQELRW